MDAVLTPTQPSTVNELEALVIHLGPLKSLMSDDEFFEFCSRNRDLRIEMTKEGEMIIMLPVGSEGGHREFNLTAEFAAWAKTDGTGIGFSSSTGFKLPNGAKRSPDLSWIRLERWNAIPKKQRKKFAPICPDFVVELRSETDKLGALKAKLKEYIENGAQLGWLIDPIEKRVHIYRPNAEVETLEHPTSLSEEPLLKGLSLNLTGIID
ncbi:MAG TPA: Uma2 family endonuclease [Blastocatellia bacterium]|nr:Uma2 family endonuclease [Blastocatellia bacterium]